MSQASHNKPPAASRPRLMPELGLVDLADTTLEERLAGKLNEQLELFACRMRQGLLAASVAIGLEVMDELIDAEVTDAAGPKGKHDPGRSAYRHGTEAGKVTLGGRRVPVVRPRVRTVADDENGQDHEVRLESYDTFAKVDLLAGHMVECLMAGLSGRRYEAALEPMGAEALHKAVRDVFGDNAVIARCRLHKERNVMDYLVQAERPWVRRKLRAAWANPDATEAEAALGALASQLDKVNPDAAASLREGLAETLTVTRLGVTGSLLKTVMGTNPVESMIEIVRDHARNVKRWQPGDMRLRWAAAGMLEASKQFRRVKGYRQLPKLATELRHTVGADAKGSEDAVA